MRDDVIEQLFSLFTSSDRAEAMAGDLAEEREHRGWVWFWLHAVGVTLALWRKAAVHAPLRVLALTAAACALVFAPALGGTVAVGLFPQLMFSPVSWIALPLFWCVGALCTGASLIAIARWRGMRACATLAVAGEALVFAFVFVVPAIASAQEMDWKDPSPHATRLVTVETDVQLEVLDWGGSGPALVLLAGLGDTAHVFDDFAPMLIARYRVVGVTRRAHGRSSAPAAGYGFARLAEDVVRVIDAVGVSKPVVVGHSIAGEELHVLGARHPATIAGLVYVDAAFNRADGSEDYDSVARTLPPIPRPGPDALASFTALRSFLERTQGFAGPEAHLRARFVANADGTVARPWAPAPPVFQAMSREIQAALKPYNPEPIRVPALAVYAVPKTAADLMQRWYTADDPAVRDAVQKLYRLARERFARHAKWFEAFSSRGRVTEIAGAHHLFISHARDVVKQIDAFMSSIATPAGNRGRVARSACPSCGTSPAPAPGD